MVQVGRIVHTHSLTIYFGNISRLVSHVNVRAIVLFLISAFCQTHCPERSARRSERDRDRDTGSKRQGEERANHVSGSECAYITEAIENTNTCSKRSLAHCSNRHTAARYSVCTNLSFGKCSASAVRTSAGASVWMPMYVYAEVHSKYRRTTAAK